jgi:serine/threonine protein kinase
MTMGRECRRTLARASHLHPRFFWYDPGRMPEAPAGGDQPRYEVLFPLAGGGMATVHLGTARGALGFRQIVAIKKPHRHLLDVAFRKAFVTEARLASLLHHANVVDVRDIVVSDDEISLVMAYVEGASFGALLQRQVNGGPSVAPGVAVRVVLDACAGLHAAHELSDERGRPLHLVHRDISPQNLLVGTDGVTRVADFGIAKFKGRGPANTSVGTLKGKLSYMAPEYLLGEKFDRRFDVFAMGIVLWEGVTGRRLFRTEQDGETMDRVLHHEAEPVATFTPSVGSALDEIFAKALAKAPADRFESALAMAEALETRARDAGILAGHREVAELVQSAVGPELEERRAAIRERLAHEPSVASVSFDRASAATAAELARTKPLPNSNLGPATTLPRPSSTTVPDQLPPVHAPSTVPDLEPPVGMESGGPEPVPVPAQPRAEPRAEEIRARHRGTPVTPETLRSEPADIPEVHELVTRKKGGAAAHPAEAVPESELASARAAERHFRLWPYVLAIVVGAVVGLAVAVTAERGAPPATPSHSGATH